MRTCAKCGHHLRFNMPFMRWVGHMVAIWVCGIGLITMPIDYFRIKKHGHCDNCG